MRVLRCLVVIAFICGFTGLAHATPADFHMHVLDPDPFPSTPIQSTPFTFSFIPCSSGELPGGMTADGCFAGVNRTGQDWDNLQITFVDNDVLAGQPADCSPAPSANIFSGSNCSLSSDIYTLMFTDGVIHNNQLFFITEDGVDPSGFGVGTATVLTPEPASIVLLSTGFVLFCVLLTMERRRVLRSSLLS